MGFSLAVSLCRFLSCRIQLLYTPLQITSLSWCTVPQCSDPTQDILCFYDSVMPRLLLKAAEYTQELQLVRAWPSCSELSWFLWLLVHGSLITQGNRKCVCSGICGWDPMASGGWHWLEVPALPGHSCSGCRGWLLLEGAGSPVQVTTCKVQSLTCRSVWSLMGAGKQGTWCRI